MAPFQTQLLTANDIKSSVSPMTNIYYKLNRPAVTIFNSYDEIALIEAGLIKIPTPCKLSAIDNSLSFAAWVCTEDIIASPYSSQSSLWIA